MKRNKALHLIRTLLWLASEAAEAASEQAQAAIGHCLRRLHAMSEAGKKQYLRSVGKAMNKDNLITIGSALHSSERPVYILWLLDRIEHYSSLFATCKDKTTKVHLVPEMITLLGSGKRVSVLYFLN
jgi:hypothetical protein